MPEGYVYLELDCATGEKLMLRRSDKPGALISVTIGDVTVEVGPVALLIAAQNLQD